MSNTAGRRLPVTLAELRADCERCAGLCCVALGMSRSADFAIDKLPGRPCPNLSPGFRCTIHARLRADGFAGCDAFDCFGAGQHVTQRTFSGRDWLGEPAIAASMFSVFDVMRQLKEALWHLAQAMGMTVDERLRNEIVGAQELVVELSEAQPDQLERLDALAFQNEVAKLLTEVSARARSGLPAAGVDHEDAALIGARLHQADLRGANLRGAQLIGADLSGADLFAADLLGTDLRGADLTGARLEGSLFLTRSQLAATEGDASTRIPQPLTRPSHWLGAPAQ